MFVIHFKCPWVQFFDTYYAKVHSDETVTRPPVCPVPVCTVQRQVLLLVSSKSSLSGNETLRLSEKAFLFVTVLKAQCSSSPARWTEGDSESSKHQELHRPSVSLVEEGEDLASQPQSDVEASVLLFLSPWMSLPLRLASVDPRECQWQRRSREKKEKKKGP